jgi:general transcription factor 3C polypeptide 3 (transcription factor C subunit 4)
MDKYLYLGAFREAADSLREAGHHLQALQFYNALKKFDPSLNSRFFFDIAICYQALEMHDEMREAVQKMRYGERNPEMQIGLARIYKSQGRFDLMWRLCLELKKMGYIEMLEEADLPTVRPANLTIQDESVPLPIEFSRARTRLIRRAKHKTQHHALNAAEKRREEEIRDQVIRTMYDDMCNLQEPIASGDANARSEWIRLANEIFEEFRGYSRFFPSDRFKPFSEAHKGRFLTIPDNLEQIIPDQLEFERPTSWREIDLDELIDLLLQYAIFLADDGDKQLAFTVLQIVELSNVVYAEAQRRYHVHTVHLRKLPLNLILLQ